MDKSDESNPKTLIIIGIIVTLLGLDVCFAALKSQAWLETTGVIISSKIVNSTDEVYIEIAYEYNIKGKKYINHRISYGDETSKTGSEVDRLFEKFSPAGKAIAVYYNPNNPQKSVLERGINFGSSWPLIMGLIVLLSGIFAAKEKTSRTLIKK